MAFHTHTQPELSNLTWYQSQVHQNLSWASANPQLSSQLKPNPWRHYQPSSVLEEERSLKHGVFSLSLNRACLYLMESVSLEAEEDGEASWTSSQSSLSKSLSHPDTRKMKLRWSRFDVWRKEGPFGCEKQEGGRGLKEKEVGDDPDS